MRRRLTSHGRQRHGGFVLGRLIDAFGFLPAGNVVGILCSRVGHRFGLKAGETW